MPAIPPVRPVFRRFNQPTVRDIPGTVHAELQKSRLRERLKPGAKVAVAVGSRGIANLKEIVLATVRELKTLQFHPFIVAAMGTHGAGTSEGQRQILADFGITEASMGIPVRTDMDAVEIGTSELGAPVYWDRNALKADGLIAINRIKAHTDYSGQFESGLLKMLVIGLGKRESPLQVHRLGGRGMEENIVASGKVVLAKAPFSLGLAILENAAEQTAMIQAVEPEELLDKEPTLLQQSKEWMAKLPFDEAEVVIIGEMGKNYSGSGLDPNVIGRRMIEGQSDFPKPIIIRLAVLDLSPESHGNAVGTGLADLVTQHLYDQIDPVAVRLNTLTARFLQRSRIPLVMATDREAIETAIDTCWEPDLSRVRLAIIPSTLELSHLYVTDPLARQLHSHETLEIGDPIELPFIDNHRLDQRQLFPHALVGRRPLIAQGHAV